MARRPRKGIDLESESVAADGGLDEREDDDDVAESGPSKTERKNASTELQRIGEALLELSSARLAALPLPEQLRDALAATKRTKTFSAMRRQKQFIGRLMRELDGDALAAARAALGLDRAQAAAENALLHRAEQWRDALIADDDRLAEWVEQYPASDVQRLRTLIRQARKDAEPPLHGQAPRHSRAYRELFRLIRSAFDA
jgi:ribosome-associated protein